MVDLLLPSMCQQVSFQSLQLPPTETDINCFCFCQKNDKFAYLVFENPEFPVQVVSSKLLSVFVVLYFLGE